MVKTQARFSEPNHKVSIEAILGHYGVFDGMERVTEEEG